MQDDAMQRYSEGVKARMEQYTKKTMRQKYAKSEEYTSFKHGIYVCGFSPTFDIVLAYASLLYTGSAISR